MNIYTRLAIFIYQEYIHDTITGRLKGSEAETSSDILRIIIPNI
ncbi:hypothetical protein [Rickettsia asiatica]|nr:hypothetical protein [Rickettsia asiatica]